MTRDETAARATTLRPRVSNLGIALWLVLGCFLAVPIVALWHAFGPKPNMAPNFTLTDQDGRPFTLSQQRGHPIILFFGYTHCPDECPTTLSHLAHALRQTSLGPDVRVAFISVDPRRDSAAVMKRYVRLFDPRFIGLTGRADQLEPVKTAYHTWSQEVPVNHGPGADYTVAHGSTVYFVDSAGRLRGLGDATDSSNQFARDLKEYFA